MSKRILILGENSFVGISFTKWLEQFKETYQIDAISSRNEKWKSLCFREYDVILHVAGIAHVDIPKENSLKYYKTKQLYYQVNRDLAINVAKKAKNEGVKQFIFMSSIIVYGDSSKIGEKRRITKNDIPSPTSFYGDSKLQAENGILALQSEDFNVTIIRPPMLYGKNTKGNYPKLSKVARLCPVFPDIENERSMLHIENLCEFIRFIIDDMACGVFCPQNREYVNTTEMVKIIAAVHGKKIYFTKIFNPIIKKLSKRLKVINKVFGNLVYDQELSNYKSKDYCVNSLEQSIIRTEGK